MPKSVVFWASQRNSLRKYLHDVCPRYGSMEALKKTNEIFPEFPCGPTERIKEFQEIQ